MNLGGSGPFEHESQQWWRFHGDSHVKHLNIRGYHDALIEAGVDERIASQVVQPLRQHGAKEVLWAGAYGQRGGKYNVVWDVVVTVTEGPAQPAIQGIMAIGESTESLVSGGLMEALVQLDDVVSIEAESDAPATAPIHQHEKPWLARVLRLPMQVKLAFEHYGRVAIASGRVGANVSVATRDRHLTDWATGRLARTLLADLETQPTRLANYDAID
jgi:hypothetical protein